MRGQHPPSTIHIGIKEAGPRVAAIISVVETCRRLKIPVRNYLDSVLPGLGDFEDLYACHFPTRLKWDNNY